MALLKVSDLRVQFQTDDGLVTAVDGVSFTVERGKALGIVGESGSGKSVTNLAVMGLLPKRKARVTGSVLWDGRELLDASDEELRKIRGGDIAMIFQDPMTSLNPVYTVGWQLEEAVRLHQDLSGSQTQARALDMLKAVGIPNARERLRAYPHELSGGMRQRVMIAMALANDPDLLIADEPTTALDVTTQAQILDLIRRLQREFDSAIVMITHDLGVVAETCDDVLVMYGGRVAEQAPVEVIFEQPQHPYTWGLMGSLPGRAQGDRLVSIPGTPPSLFELPPGCRFAPRCTFAFDACRRPPVPDLTPSGGIDSRHWDACLLDGAAKRAHAAELLGVKA